MRVALFAPLNVYDARRALRTDESSARSCSVPACCAKRGAVAHAPDPIASGEPPRGSPWDDPLLVAPLAFVDLEMTGLERDRDRVVEICIERVRGGTLEARMSCVVRPEGDEPGGGAKIHGIPPAELANAPPFAELAAEVVRLLDGAVLVAHGADHDVAFLQAELARTGRQWRCVHFIDTLLLSRRAFNFQSHRLVALAKELAVESPTSHRADNDVRVLRAIFARIVAELRPMTLRDLWHVRVGAGHVRPEILATVERALASRTPARVRYRSAGRAAKDIVFHVTALRRDVDPPVATGYLDHTRGRRELRIDRILSIELLGGS
ncbi:MAG: 3'-5' exonuclease [Myxococcales bacterium]|nr:3'-5' exonuclease [Myxococcales bacterium]